MGRLVRDFMSRMLRAFVLVMAVPLTNCFGGSAFALGEKLPLTVTDAIQTARFMGNPSEKGASNPDGAVSISPNGKRYVARLVRGDVKANGVWMELITGSMRSAKAAAHYESVVRLFTTGLGAVFGTQGPVLDIMDHASPIRWIDDDQLMFLWTDSRQVRQVVRVDLRSHRLEYLTHHPTDVASFEITSAGAVVYGALMAYESCPAAADDEMVISGDVDSQAVFRGDLCNGTMIDRASNTEWFVQDTPTSTPRKLRLDGRAYSLDIRQRIDLSSDGRHALINLPVGKVPESWTGYDDRDLKMWIDELQRGSADLMARNVHRLFVLDIKDGSARPLWDAATIIHHAKVGWSPDGRRVALAPVFLPPNSSNPQGRRGRAAVVVNVADGSYEVLPGEFPVYHTKQVRWGREGVTITVDTEKGVMRHSFRRQGQAWRVEIRPLNLKAASVRIELQQDLNTPPKLVAVDTRSEHVWPIIDPNPGLAEKFDLGHREYLTGTLPTGEDWRAILFYPPNYSSERRYPLMIQSVYGPGHRDGEFTLYGAQDGAGLGPTVYATYPGQLLANRGFMVAHLIVSTGGRHNTPEEAPIRMRGFEQLSLQLAQAGKVDPERVGLIGFSRNGYYVQYTLTHSSFDFAAAISADNWDPSYFSRTLFGYSSAASAVNGGEPFGDGLLSWLKNAPAFNVDQVRTPLRMIEQSFGRYGALLRWEWFSRLRYLNKPVEMYLPPDPEHGAHNTQNPRQIIALMQGSIDWFEFWLCDREDSNPAKAAQYERWRKLRAMTRERAVENRKDFH